MKITIDSMLTISGSTTEQTNKIIQENTYKNPEYQSAVNMKRSTHNIDKYIQTYSLEGDVLMVPRGYLHELPHHELTDNTHTRMIIFPSLDGVVLRGYQSQAVNDALLHNQGIIQAGTGSGKTIMGLELIKRRMQKTLILTHSKALMTQWQGEIKKLLGVECGLVGGGKNTQNDITICMLQTLSKNPALVTQLSIDYGLVLLDEAHHIPAKQFAKVINNLGCKYRYGLTATPHRRDGLHQLINRHIGKIISVVSDNDVKKVNGVVPITVRQIDTNRSYHVKDWNEYINKLTNDRDRNQMIVDMAVKA